MLNTTRGPPRYLVVAICVLVSFSIIASMFFLPHNFRFTSYENIEVQSSGSSLTQGSAASSINTLVKRQTLQNNFSRSELQALVEYTGKSLSDDESSAEAPIVDIVITWCNASDPDFLKRAAMFPDKIQARKQDNQRYKEHNELLFAMRSVYVNIPWVRQIILVTGGERPWWLDLNDSRVRLVTHDEIWANVTQLPTFSSVSIENQLHRIPGLADKYIKMDDDFIIASPVWPHHFWTLNEREEKNYKIYAASNGALSTPSSSWIQKGGYWAWHGHAVKIFDDLLGERNVHGLHRPGIPYHIPELIDKKILTEMLKIPQIAERINESAGHRFRKSRGFRLAYAYQLYLMEWPKHDADRTLTFEQRVMRYNTSVLPSEPFAQYFAIGTRTAEVECARLRAAFENRKPKLFWCLNDIRGDKTDLTQKELEEADQAIQILLRSFFTHAPWELDPSNEGRLSH